MKFLYLLITFILSTKSYSFNKKENGILLNKKIIKKSKEISLGRFAPSWRFGYSNLETETSSRQSIFSIELDARYAIHDYVGFNLNFNKWFAANSSINDNSGNLALQTGFGVVFGINSSLIRKTYKLSYYRKKIFYNKNNKITKTKKKIKKKYRNLNGFRLGIMATSMEFSKLESPVYGSSISLFYEKHIKNNFHIQYGIRSDRISHEYVNFNPIQGFVGILITP